MSFKLTKLNYWFKKKTEKTRYKIASIILKHLTPVLYERIDINTFIDHKSFLYKADNVLRTLRPSFIFIKKIFGEKLLIGAEIGVERGKNSKCILKELNIEKLYLIDLWENYDEIEITWSHLDNNYKHVQRIFENDVRVKIIKDFSENAVNHIEKDSLDFVYIDGNHSYEYVYKDIELYYIKVKKDKVIAGHDVFLNDGILGGVLDAVKDFCFKYNIYFYVENPDWYFIKTKQINEVKIT